MALPVGWRRGFRITRTSSTVATVAVGVCRDDTNAVDMALDSPVAIDTTTTGAAALDTGTIANDTLYHVWVCNGASGTTAVLSLAHPRGTPSSPTLPAGYDDYQRYVGTIPYETAALFPTYVDYSPTGMTAYELGWDEAVIYSGSGPGTGGLLLDASPFVAPRALAQCDYNSLRATLTIRRVDDTALYVGKSNSANDRTAGLVTVAVDSNSQLEGHGVGGSSGFGIRSTNVWDAGV